MPYSYVSRTSLKDRVADSLTDDDALYRAVLEAATREIDDLCGRTFQPHTATRYYRAHDAYTLVLPDERSIQVAVVDYGERTAWGYDHTGRWRKTLLLTVCELAEVA